MPGCQSSKAPVSRGIFANPFVDRQHQLHGKDGPVSLPYRSGDPIDWTETRYDGLGRVRQVIPPDGSASANFTEYRYAWTTLSVPGSALPLRMRIEAVFDASGVGRASVYDAAGRLREVREDASSLDLSSSTLTHYDPSPAGSSFTHYEPRWSYGAYNYESVLYSHARQTEITQGVQTRLFTRDSLGRLLEETHPENGTQSYAYDDDGNLLTKTDARGVTATTSYDTLHRPLTVTYSDATPPASSEIRGRTTISVVNNRVRYVLRPLRDP